MRGGEGYCLYVDIFGMIDMYVLFNVEKSMKICCPSFKSVSDGLTTRRLNCQTLSTSSNSRSS